MIPFIATNEYTLSVMTLPDDKTHGIDFTSYGNTKEEVLEYLEKFSSWTRTYTDLDNDFGYSFVEFRKNNLIVEIHFATDAEKYLLVLVYPDITDTNAPSEEPTEEPTNAPTEEPTNAPTEEPTNAPTEKPTDPPAPPASEEKVLSFADTSTRESITVSDTNGKQVWSANGITLTNIGHIADNSNPVRLYKNTAVTIECADMKVLVFKCFNEDYALALVSSLGNGAVADGKVVTLVLSDTVDEITFTCASQIRLDSLTVNPADSGGTDPIPPVEEPTSDPSTPPTESDIDYGTLAKPVTTTYASQVNASLRNEEFSTSPFYVKGTVTYIESMGNYYKNVYITDGATDLHIYTINMGDGVTGFEVGDVIVAYGYFVNYNGDIGLATYKPDDTTRIYVYAVDVDEDEGGVVTPPSSSHTYTDFTSGEKAMFIDAFGFVIPFIPNDEYYVKEFEYEGVSGLSFYTFDNTAAEFEAYRALFSDFVYDGTENDEYGDPWYFYYKGNVYVEMSYYLYEGVYVVDIYVYLTDDGETPTSAPETPTEEPTEAPTSAPETPTEEQTDAPVTPSVPFEATLSFADKANRTEFSGTVQVWTQNGITLTNNKDASTSAVADYADPARFYASSSVTVERNGMLKIVFECNAAKYVTALVNSLADVSGADVSTSGTTVTVEFSSPVNSLTFICSAQIRLNSLTVTSNSQGGSGEGGDVTPPSSSHTYKDFTSDEKAAFTDTFGFVIPFIPNDEYYVEEYEFEVESGLNFYAFGNTLAEFNSYLTLFSDYSNDGTDIDDYGDKWYFFSKGDVYIDVSYYLYEDAYVVDVYVYFYDESGSGGEGGTATPSDLITNDGAGLPEDDGDGIYDVDFTKGQYVQNVTDQGYYLDGCPTTGAPAVLVIPVEFSDITASSKGYTIGDLNKIFTGTTGETNYYSVHDYFFKSSYEKLDLQITVLDSWFKPKNNSSYYANATYEYYGYEVAIGDQLILDEALAYLSTIMDLSVFDSDGNNVIDAVVMVTTLEINSDEDFYWAYRYWNIYTDDNGYYYEYDGVSANDYAWIPYEFMYEGYDEDGNLNYNTANPLNPYTFIHEFSHILGADDYYDTSYTEHPMGGADMMDAMQGDHNPYTKFNYGWLTTSKLITTNSSVTLSLNAFVNSGDTVILATNWDESLGAYQEYFVVMYYKGEGLNAGEGGYFARDGIIVFHINASLYAEAYDGETYYDVYFNNTDPSDQYGTEYNLIEYVKSGEGNYTYIEGDSLPTVSDYAGNALEYTFTVDSIDGNKATLTFSKIG